MMNLMSYMVYKAQLYFRKDFDIKYPSHLCSIQNARVCKFIVGVVHEQY